MLHQMEGPKLPLSEWLVSHINKARNLETLVLLGTIIVEVRLESGHQPVVDAWRKRWLPFHHSGQLEKAERWFYYQIITDLCNQRRDAESVFSAKIAKLQKSVKEMELVVTAPPKKSRPNLLRFILRKGTDEQEKDVRGVRPAASFRIK